MFTALDKTEGRIVTIDYILSNSLNNDKSLDYKNTHDLVCPYCNNKVVVKHGKVVTGHFAHVSNKNCDSWSDGINMWKKDYLSRYFDLDEAKVEVPINGHKADIYVDKNKTVLILQPKSITYDLLKQKINHFDKDYNLVYLINFTNHPLTEKDLKPIDDDLYLSTVTKTRLGRNIPTILNYLLSSKYRIKLHDKKKFTRLFIDNGNGIYEVCRYKDLLKKHIVLKRHDYRYFDRNIVLGNPYEGYNAYMNDNDEIVIKNKQARNIKKKVSKE